RRADALERRTQRAARGGEVGWPRLSPCQHFVQQRQELASVGAERSEPRGQVGFAAVLKFLEEQLGVADDVVQRRAQLVTKLRGGIDAHAPAARPSSASIFSISRARSTGLVSKSAQPGAMGFSRSPDMAGAGSGVAGTTARRGGGVARRVE